MFDLFFLGSIFFFSILCFLEVVVFNEEILLALCFFSFVFFAFNSLGASIFESFNSRSAKFESDLLESYSFTKDLLVSTFKGALISRDFVTKLQLLSELVSVYLVKFRSYSKFQLNTTLSTLCLAKLGEFYTFENKLLESYKSKITSLLLYPLIFSTVKSLPTIDFSKHLLIGKTSTFRILKNLSV